MSYGIVHYEDAQGEIGVGIPCRTQAEYEAELAAEAKWIEGSAAYRGMWGEVLQPALETEYQSINRLAGYADVDQISPGSHLDDFGRVSS
jgi:hypothetical protein